MKKQTDNTPTNVFDNMPDLLTDKYLMQVTEYAQLAYSPARIGALLKLTTKLKAILELRLTTPGDVYFEAYEEGRALAENEIDKRLLELAKTGDKEAITLMAERHAEREENDLRKKLFGV